MTEQKTEVEQELPFSSELIELFYAWMEGDPQDREGISLELAAVFSAEHDPTELFSEDYHKMFEDYQEAQLKFEQQSMKLSRMAVQVIGSYLDKHCMTLEGVVTDGSPAN